MNDCLSFDTRAALGNARVPAGTESVVIEQFDLSSAPSAARYIPVESNPGHDLSVLNNPGDNWWAIHPDDLSLEAAGAPADVSGDCTSAMQRVFGYLAAVNRAKLQLKERDYVLKSRATLAQSSGDPPLRFTIEGRGQSTSRLLVQYPDNVAGAFAIGFADDQSEFVARGFSVIATGATGRNACCGTAITAEFADRAELECGPAHGAVIADMLIGSDETIAKGGCRPVFAHAIDITGAGRPSICDCTISGPTGPDAMASV